MYFIYVLHSLIKNESSTNLSKWLLLVNNLIQTLKFTLSVRTIVAFCKSNREQQHTIRRSDLKPAHFIYYPSRNRQPRPIYEIGKSLSKHARVVLCVHSWYFVVKKSDDHYADIHLINTVIVLKAQITLKLLRMVYSRLKS